MKQTPGVRKFQPRDDAPKVRTSAALPTPLDEALEVIARKRGITKSALLTAGGWLIVEIVKRGGDPLLPAAAAGLVTATVTVTANETRAASGTGGGSAG